MAKTEEKKEQKDLPSPVDGDEVKMFGKRMLIGLIAEEDITAGFLLAGIGEGHENFFIVSEDTQQADIIEHFLTLYRHKSIGIILLGMGVAQKLTEALTTATEMLPVIIVIPS